MIKTEDNKLYNILRAKMKEFVCRVDTLGYRAAFSLALQIAALV